MFSKSLFRGGLSTIQCIAISNFIYFYTFHGLKRTISSAGNQSAKKDLLFAFLAGKFDRSNILRSKLNIKKVSKGVTNVLVTNPIWVVNIHLKMQDVEKNNLGGKVKRINGLCGIIFIFSTLLLIFPKFLYQF